MEQAVVGNVVVDVDVVIHLLFQLPYASHYERDDHVVVGSVRQHRGVVELAATQRNFPRVTFYRSLE